MNLPKSVLIKPTKSLFLNQYNYKIVLVSSRAQWFRRKNYDFVRQMLNRTGAATYHPNAYSLDYSCREYCVNLLNTFESFDQNEFQIRVENPFINVYTNSIEHVELLAAIDPDWVKSVFLPDNLTRTLNPNTVVVKTLNYDYKVFLKTIKDQDNSSFLSWANDNKKIRMSANCLKDLNRSTSRGGSYFYVKDEKTLTMVKMFLGAHIRNIVNVIKA